MEIQSMTLLWESHCVFIFKVFQSRSVGGFILGCFITSLLAVLTVAMPTIKNKMVPDLSYSYSMIGEGPKKTSTAENVKLAFYYLFYSTLHMTIMLLVMTMNGFVDLVILFSITIAYYFFEAKKDQKQCCSQMTNENQDK